MTLGGWPAGSHAGSEKGVRIACGFYPEGGKEPHRVLQNRWFDSMLRNPDRGHQGQSRKGGSSHLGMLTEEHCLGM